MAIKIQKQKEIRKRVITYKKQKIQTYIKGTGKHKILLLQKHPLSGLEIDKIPFFPNCTFISIDIPGWIGNSTNTQLEYIEIYKIYKHIINKLGIRKIDIISFDILTPIAIKLISDTDKISKGILIKPIFKSRKENKTRIKILNNKILKTIYNQILRIKYTNTNTKNITNHYLQYINSNLYPNLIKLNNINLLIVNPYKDQIEYIRKVIGNESIQTIYTETIDNNIYKQFLEFLK